MVCIPGLFFIRESLRIMKGTIGNILFGLVSM